MNTGADGSFEIGGTASKIAVHLADTFLHDAFDGASPAGMEHSNRALFGIDHDHRDAVGGQDGEQ